MSDNSSSQSPGNQDGSGTTRSDDADAILVSLLNWYQEMGVDAAIDSNATDWLAHGDLAPGQAVREALRQHASQDASKNTTRPQSRSAGQAGTSARPPAPASPASPASERSAPSGATQPGPPQRRFTPGPPDKTVADAQALAAKISNLAELRTSLETFDGCGLKATAKNTCVYRGAETARLMIIGEAPGRDEDLEGKPFVGRAGQLLDKMLAAIGIDETSAHITNVVYWRPPGNRTPTPLEAQICRPFLERQIAIVAPEVILLLGAAASRNLLDTTDGIMRLRGKWREATFGGHDAKVIASLHPAYLLRTPAAKRLVWRDLLAVRQVLAETQ